MRPEEARQEINKIKVKQMQFKNALKYYQKRNRDERTIWHKIGEPWLIKNELNKFKNQHKFDKYGRIEEDLCKDI